MNITTTVRGFVQEVTPRKKYDERARAYTDEIELTPDGERRFTLILAVVGERESIRISTDESQLLEAYGTTQITGQIIALTYTASVSVKWASVDSFEEGADV